MSEEYSKSLPFSKDFQYSILKHMITDEVFLGKCERWLEEEFFSADKCLQWMFRTIIAYWRDYKSSPSMHILENEAMKFSVDTQPDYFKTINAVLSADEIPHSYLSRELTAFVRRNKFADIYHKAANLYNNYNEDAYTMTQEAINELIQIDLAQDDVSLFANSEQYIKEESEAVKEAVPTGIEALDRVMHGGLPKSALSVFLSGTNSGKSMVLINLVKFAVESGRKVVFIGHEDPEGPTMLRFISCFTGIPFNKLLCAGLLTGAEKSRVKALEEYLDRFLVCKFMYGSDVTVEEVVSWLRLKKKEFDFDMVIDDYGQFIRTAKKYDQERFVQVAVHKTLKQTALELDIAMVTCAQGTRDAQKVSKKGLDFLRSTDISECFDIGRRADVVISLNRSDVQAANNELIYYLEKQRHGIRDVAVKCYTDFSRCTTHERGKQVEVDARNPLLSEKVSVNSGLDDKDKKQK